MIVSKLWTLLSQSRSLVHVTVKLGNQCAAVASRHLSNSSDPELNGEVRLISVLGTGLTRVIDVGANVGDWAASIIEHSPHCDVICYEPSSACADHLRRRFAGRVMVRQVALSDEVGNKPFASEKLFGTSSALLSGYANGKDHDVEQVPVSTLDEEFATGETIIDLLKIDTEGFDLHVLRGATGLLKSGRIKFVQFEFSHFWSRQGSTLDASFKLLGDLGYEIRLLNGRGLYAFDISKWRRWFDYGNFVAFAPVNRSKLQPLLVTSRL